MYVCLYVMYNSKGYVRLSEVILTMRKGVDAHHRVGLGGNDAEFAIGWSTIELSEMGRMGWDDG